MRYRAILPATVAGALLAAGCTSIEDYPDGRLDFEQIFNSASKTGGYMNTCYGGAVVNYGNIYGNSSFLAALTDDAHDVDDIVGGPMSRWNNGYLTPADNPVEELDRWDRYVSIRKCNIMLENVETAKVMLESEREMYRGEARGLRAYYYLQLIKTYGGVPLLLANRTEEETDWEGVERASFSDCARQIIADCRYVIDNNTAMGWRSGSSDDGDRSRWSKGMCAAVMSEAALYAASPLNNDGSLDWAEAAQVCREALDGCLDNGYALSTTTPTGDYAKTSYNAYDLYFLTTPDVAGVNDPESIMWGRNRLTIWAYDGLPTTYGGTRAGSCPSQELIDCYETLQGEMPILGYSDADHLHPIINPAADYSEADPYANRDPRLKASIYYDGALLTPRSTTEVEIAEGGNCEVSATSQRYTRTGYYVRKLSSPSSSSRGNSDGYFRVFRLAELYLNYAEAANEAAAGNTAPDAAIDAVNAVRARVGMPALPKGMSKDDFRARVLNERRVELAFEDHRFYDLRRRMMLADHGNVVTGMRVNAAGDYERFVVARRSSTSNAYLRLPIPEKEVARLMKATGRNFQNSEWNQ